MENGSASAAVKRPITEEDENSQNKRTRTDDQRGMLSDLVKKISSNNTDSTTTKPIMNKYDTVQTSENRNSSQPIEGR